MLFCGCVLIVRCEVVFNVWAVLGLPLLLCLWFGLLFVLKNWLSVVSWGLFKVVAFCRC